jgi:hypothetical protein
MNLPLTCLRHVITIYIYPFRRLKQHVVRITFLLVLFKRRVTTLHAHKLMPQLNAEYRVTLVRASSGYKQAVQPADTAVSNDPELAALADGANKFSRKTWALRQLRDLHL